MNLLQCVSAVAAALLWTTLATGEDDLFARPVCAANNSMEIEIRDCVNGAARAANEENLEAYVECFCNGLHRRMRRRAGMLFVQHEVAVEVVDCHLLEVTPDWAEVAVRYRATLTALTYDIVSVIHVKREEDAWKIGRERVETSRETVKRTGPETSANAVCFGGQCRVAQP